MPTKDQLESALRNAHEAGDTEAARILANAIKEQREEAALNLDKTLDSRQEAGEPFEAGRLRQDIEKQKEVVERNRSLLIDASNRNDLTDSDRHYNDYIRSKEALRKMEEELAPHTSPYEEILRGVGGFLQDRVKERFGQAEAASSIVSSTLSMIPAGLAGIGVGINPLSPEGASAWAVEEVSEALRYNPRTVQGKENLEKIGGNALVQGIGDIMNKVEQSVGDIGFDIGESLGPESGKVKHTLSASLGTVAMMIPNIVMEAMGYGAGRLVKAGARSAKQAQDSRRARFSEEMQAEQKALDEQEAKDLEHVSSKEEVYKNARDVLRMKKLIEKNPEEFLKKANVDPAFLRR